MASAGLKVKYEGKEYNVRTGSKGSHYIEVPLKRKTERERKVYVKLSAEEKKRAPPRDWVPAPPAPLPRSAWPAQGRKTSVVIIKLRKIMWEGTIGQGEADLAPQRLTPRMKSILYGAFESVGAHILEYHHKAGSSLVYLGVLLPKKNILGKPIKTKRDIEKLVKEDILKAGVDSWMEGPIHIDPNTELTFQWVNVISIV